MISRLAQNPINGTRGHVASSNNGKGLFTSKCAEEAGGAEGEGGMDHHLKKLANEGNVAKTFADVF